VILPAAPELTVAQAKRTAPANLLPPLAQARKTFIPPVEAVHQATPNPVSLPAAPTLAETAAARPLLTTAPLTTPMAKPLREFIPPKDPVRLATAAPPLAEAPPVAAANHPAEATMAIVGLFPTRHPEIPTPKASQEAGFSAGPRPQPTGANDAPQQSQLVVPSLLARSGNADRQAALASLLEPPTSLDKLMAAARADRMARPAPDGTGRMAAHVSDAPDPRLAGRMVYSMALQMPNVTSYSGSWMVWFAERAPDAHSPAPSGPGIRAPVPVRKVDPKYVPAAVEERVEGKVRLAAVIRKDGSVDSVEVVRGLDERLDRSAREALAGWKFEPARRNGTAIDVDAVFEIPFHLAPRVTQ
jgi:TonB family protein